MNGGNAAKSAAASANKTERAVIFDLKQGILCAFAAFTALFAVV